MPAIKSSLIKLIGRAGVNQVPCLGLLATAIILTSSCATQSPGTESQTVCSDAWYQSVERRVVTQDGQGHGPDLGSMEWRSSIQFRLGLRDDASVPPLDSPAWCGFIEAVINAESDV